MQKTQGNKDITDVFILRCPTVTLQDFLRTKYDTLRIKHDPTFRTQDFTDFPVSKCDFGTKPTEADDDQAQLFNFAGGKKQDMKPCLKRL